MLRPFGAPPPASIATDSGGPQGRQIQEVMLTSGSVTGSGGTAPRRCRLKVRQMLSTRPIFTQTSCDADATPAANTCPGRARTSQTRSRMVVFTFNASTATK